MAGRVPPLYLASSSPRRSALLSSAGIAFQLVTPGHEPVGSGMPFQLCTLRAREKAVHASGFRSPGIVLGVDTIVECDGRELDKPGDADLARATLRLLSGRDHLVHTAHSLFVTDSKRLLERTVTARVRCARLDDATITRYVATGEWTDKAGGYGIQGAAGAFMTLVDGDLDTVIGMSVRTVRELLAELRDAPESGAPGGS